MRANNFFPSSYKYISVCELIYVLARCCYVCCLFLCDKLELLYEIYIIQTCFSTSMRWKHQLFKCPLTISIDFAYRIFTTAMNQSDKAKLVIHFPGKCFGRKILRRKSYYEGNSFSKVSF